MPKLKSILEREPNLKIGRFSLTFHVPNRDFTFSPLVLNGFGAGTNPIMVSLPLLWFIRER